MELTIALAVAALLTGLVVSRISKTPVFATAEKISSSLQGLFSSASFMSQSSNKVVELAFNKDTLSFDIIQEDTSSPFLGDMMSEKFPEGLEITFEVEEPIFRFYPDGTASGPPFSIEAEKYKMDFRVSSLTGILLLDMKKK